MKDFMVYGSAHLLKLISKEKPDFSGKIKLRIDRLTEREAARYERKLNHWHEACGCELGAVFCILSLAGYCLFALVTLKIFNWSLIGNGLLVVFVSSLTGKISGITLAKYRFKKMVQALIKKLN
ncbi:hypothetical protein [Sinomicrobium weinanense]|uniref:Uncharacterized protein n=1 Tax=Sinomicrobium weinanense TaxID=2842200 RepID=A0A926JPI0_9FLAO|nr:hypothetical protein [Sinomicrobium weinanense]MBC9794939.1 hypothetical protein [Sinomicrobium weinanense]MBU3125710.1 hypothetical protein [Sinomicrobium weinanense]